MKADFPFKATERFPSLHAPTICRCGGSLMVACYGGEREGSEDSAIIGATYDSHKDRWDSGVWLDVKDRAPANPRLFPEPDRKEIWLLSGVNYGRWCSGDTYLFVKRTKDYGRNWTDLELLVEDKGLLGRTRPLELGDRWILPVEDEKAWWPVFLVSKDDGQSWQRKKPNIDKTNPHLIQPTIVKLESGELLAYLRSQEGVIYETKSDNYGDSWTSPEPTELPNNNSGIDLIKLKSGNLLLVHNPTSSQNERSKLSDKWPESMPEGFKRWGRRTPLRLSISFDEGDTWEKVQDVENGPGEYSYPSMIQDKKGQIHLVYTYKREAIKYLSFFEEDIKGRARR